METVLPSCTSSNNSWSAFYRSMVKQKLELTFTHGFILGLLTMFFIWSGIIQTFFVSKEVFKLEKIYIDGKMYKLSEYR